MDFSHINTQYRSIPFWSWNDKLDCDVLREQIRQMHDAGIGGFFMHARGGLQTEYLSQEWMDCVNACLDEAGKLGMEAWLYDENGWPSGFSSGKVNGKGIAYQQKYLRMEKGCLSSLGSENTIAWYSADGTFISRETPTDSEKEYIRCFFEVNPYYVDNLDSRVVREFIDSTHEFYKKNIPAKLLPHLKGVFTDEPQLSRKGYPWSLILEDTYRREYARELIEELPLLMMDGKDSCAVRVRFWRLVTGLFNQSFMKQIHDWCSANNWLLTGHHVLEETLQNQIPSNGSIMVQYEHYDIPGMDLLCRRNASPVAMNQLVSVAMQTGKKQILSESFAMTGWNMNFSGMHWVFNQQLAHGINLLCQHLQGYSLRGLRKRDYPSSNFVHQPWWGDYRKVNDFFARAGELLANGKAVTDVVVIHPLSSGWCLFNGDSSDPVLAEYTQSFKNLSEALDAVQINHHYADELITEKTGSVEDGIFRIGECSYKMVVIPALFNLSADMLQKLMTLSAAGVPVLKLKNTIGDHPLTVDGKEPSAEAARWFAELEEFTDAAELAQKAASLLPDLVQVSGEGAGEIVTTRRYFGKDLFYFAAGKSCDQTSEVRLFLPGNTAYCGVIDNETGKVFRLTDAVRCEGGFTVERTLFPGEAVMFYLSDDLADAEPVSFPAVHKMPCLRKIDSRFTVQETGEGNIITLDRCRYKVDDGAWEYNDFCVIHPRLIDLERPCRLEMECDFVLADSYDLSKPLTLIVETPDKFEFALNGQPFDGKSNGTLFDQAFHRVILPSNLKHGVNTISMKCDYAQSQAVYDALPKARLFETEFNKMVYDSEIENIYLLGDFSVDFEGKILDLDHQADRLCGSFKLGGSVIGRELDAEDMVPRGLPFFAGKLKLSRKIELTAQEVRSCRYLRFTPVNANSYKFIINDVETPLFYNGSPAVDVKNLLREGTNTIELEITTSLRNMLGPHHLEDGESFAVSPISFNKEPNSLKRALPYNANYCCVKLGIKDIELV